MPSTLQPWSPGRKKMIPVEHILNLLSGWHSIVLFFILLVSIVKAPQVMGDQNSCYSKNGFPQITFERGTLVIIRDPSFPPVGACRDIYIVTLKGHGQYLTQIKITRSPKHVTLLISRWIFTRWTGTRPKTASILWKAISENMRRHLWPGMPKRWGQWAKTVRDIESRLIWEDIEINGMILSELSERKSY